MSLPSICVFCGASRATNPIYAQAALELGRTLEELFEVWTWGQLGYQQKPLGLLEVNGFFGKLCSLLDHLLGEGFVRPEHRAMLQSSGSAEEPLAPAKWAEQHKP